MERPETRYARNGDVSIAYQSVGDTDADLTVVLCPGFVSNVELCWAEPVFHRLIERTAGYARVVLFDKRGTGLSDPVSAPPTFEERTDDIRAVLDHAGVERAALVGISEGGPMSMLFAATHPDRVTHLVLYGTYAMGAHVAMATGDPRAVAWYEEMMPILEESLEHWGEGRSLAAFAHKVASRPLERRIWGGWERSGSSPSGVRHLMDSALVADVRSVLDVISVPTLVLHFEDDRAIPAWNGEDLAAAIPGAQLTVLPGGDHVTFDMHELDRLADEVQAFLTGVRPAAPAERQLLTVVFTDIVASTERAAELGDAAWGELLRTHDQAVRSVLAEHRGREVKTLGDGFLATFDGPGRAVAFAASIREQVRAIGLEVRVGIHTGECDVTQDDIRGLAVNIASRVCSQASPGEVLLTTTVRDLTAGSGVVTSDRGAHVLKGVPGEWALAGLGSAPAAPSSAPVHPTTTTATRRTDRVLDVLAQRYPRFTRAGVRAARSLART